VALGGWLIWKKSSEPPVGEGFNLCFTANTLGKEAQIEAIWGRLKWLEPYNTGYRRVTFFCHAGFEDLLLALE